jgi:hypothetical protein
MFQFCLFFEKKDKSFGNLLILKKVAAVFGFFAVLIQLKTLHTKKTCIKAYCLLKENKR